MSAGWTCCFAAKPSGWEAAPRVAFVTILTQTLLAAAQVLRNSEYYCQTFGVETLDALARIWLRRGAVEPLARIVNPRTQHRRKCY